MWELVVAGVRYPSEGYGDKIKATMLREPSNVGLTGSVANRQPRRDRHISSHHRCGLDRWIGHRIYDGTESRGLRELFGVIGFGI